MPGGRQLRVTIWNENVHEQRDEAVRRIYPDGMHGAIADGLRRELGGNVTIRVATLEEPEHGLTTQALAETDVLTWWGHAAHDKVDDEVVERVQARVLNGMGLVVLHSGHYSKIFRRLMGTSCALRWRSDEGGAAEHAGATSRGVERSKLRSTLQAYLGIMALGAGGHEGRVAIVVSDFI